MQPVFLTPSLRRLATLCLGLILTSCISLSPDWSPSSGITKSPLDDKSYRALTLDNGLRVLLISDPDADKSAAALDVHVGSGHDPKDRQGLAHYLEHMLFLGTDKYPEAGQYQKYIADHGGNKNAYTVISDTNYHFSIDPDFLFPALDQFAQFFIAPTFTEKYVQRERAIVQSEYKARLKDESRRLWTAQRVAYNPDHPTTQFSVGSETTLADRSNDPIREDLIAFYRQYYVAPNMALTVLGRESLDQLQEKVSELFAGVRAEGERGPLFTEPLFKQGALPARLDLKPLIETRRLTFTFPIESVRPHYQSKPLNYIASILGHEGQGSILAALKKRGWAEALSAGGGYMDGVQGVVDISIKMTPEGLNHIQEVGAYLFTMVGKIAREGIAQWRFEEEQQLSKLDFRFQEAVDPYSLVRSLASRMQRLPAEDILAGPYLLEHCAPELIQQFLAALTPDNLLLTVVDPALEAEHKTDWYEVAYQQSMIDSDWQAAWSAALAAELTEPDLVGQVAALTLPARNPFVPENIELVADTSESSQPRRLDGLEPLSAWHQTHTDFNLPKASFFFSVKSPIASDSPAHALLTELLVKAVNDAMNAYSYPAYQAGLHYSLYRHSRGVSVRISGYADKQSVLLARILDELKGVTISETKFQQYKRELGRDLANRLKGRPSDIAIGALYDILMTNSWSPAEQQTAVSELSLEDLRAHHQALFESVELVALSMGSVTKEQSIARATQVANAFAEADRASVPRPQLRQISNGMALACPLPLAHPDAAFSLYLQGKEKSIHELALMRVLGALVEPQFYRQLRTENEVGYLVYATPFNVLDVPALLLSVQSNTHSVQDIGSLVEAFQRHFVAYLATLSDTDYKTTRQGLLSQLREAPSNLGELAERYWAELDRSAFGFDTRKKLIKAIEGTDKQSVTTYYKGLMADRETRRLLTLSYGQLDPTLPNGQPLPFQRNNLKEVRLQLNTYFAESIDG